MKDTKRGRVSNLFKVAAVLFLGHNFYGVHSIDLESSKEMPCFSPDLSQIAPIDVNWVSQQTELMIKK